MQFQQMPNRMNGRSMPEAAMPSSVEPTVKEIPYDYVATFTLDGRRPGNRVQDVINVSTDGAFVAVAVGYSFIPNSLPIRNPNGLQFFFDEGGERGSFRPNPLLAFVELFVEPSGDAAQNLRRQQQQTQIIQSISQCMLVRMCGIDFKYSIVDSGSGRELQNQAIHNIAGLGKSDGDRPFRPLAKPMIYAPRSSIRIEIEEISVGPIYEGAKLFIVLHGYKMLNYGTA